MTPALVPGPVLDDLGRRVDVPASVGRVVSLVPSLTEAVAATGPGRTATARCSSGRT